MQKLFALVLILLGISTGVAVGLVMKPVAQIPAETSEPAPIKEEVAETETDFLKLGNQFLIPLIQNDDVGAMVALSLELEIQKGTKDGLYSKEPKIRDAFLQIMFDHANAGGFSGRFTESSNMEILKRSLTDAAKNITDEDIIAVLITDIARQDF